MKKTLISTALSFTPKKLQIKALCKALNYLFPSDDIAVLNNQIIKLTVVDFKNGWFVTCDGSRFNPSDNIKENVEIAVKLESVLGLQNRGSILQALKNEDIQLKGKPELSVIVKKLLLEVNEKRLISLSKSLFSFLRIKPIKSEKRFDINTLKLSDLKTPADINAVRDEALRIESENLEEALVLMTLAHQARPKGTMIANKVIEYKKVNALEDELFNNDEFLKK